MMTVYFDIEADGFFYDVTQLWCMSASVDGAPARSYTDAEEFLTLLQKADIIVGHNIIGYDLPVLEKLFPKEFRIDYGKAVDTLVLSRLLCPDLSNTDRSEGASIEPADVGSHSLGAWGQRLGYQKIVWEHGFAAYHPDMVSYCERDVDVTVRLYQELLTKSDDSLAKAIELEHRVAKICTDQEHRGFPFDVKAAETLVAQIHKEQLALDLELQDTFTAFYKRLPGEPFVPKCTTKGNANIGKPPGTWAGAPYSKVALTLFNPNSRQHIANRLSALYGWEPKETTPSGQAKIDETVLAKLDYPEAKLLTRYMLLQKRYSYLLNEDDERGLLNNVKDGRVHGRIITNGAVTGRGTHKLIANLPRVTTEYGPELRALFTPSAGKVQVGVDMSGIELRLLAHYMSYADNGEYAKQVVEGDIHTFHQKLLGLDTRDKAKTFIYAFIYGAGDAKLGSIAAPTDNLTEQRKHGKLLKSRMFQRLPALGTIVHTIHERLEDGKPIRGLDGRRLTIRSEHAALNTLLQSAGAILSKQWMADVDDMHYPTANQLIWYHDELQFEVDPDRAEDFGQLVVNCIQTAGDRFNVRVPLAGEFKIGNNWKECH